LVHNWYTDWYTKPAQEEAFMLCTSTPHLYKRSGRYYFRTRIPASLKDRFCTNELKYSLKTVDHEVAKKRAKGIAERVSMLFQCLDAYTEGPMAMLTAEQLKETVRKYIIDGFNIDAAPKDPFDADRQYALIEDRIAEFNEKLNSDWDFRQEAQISRSDTNGQMVTKSWIDWKLEKLGLSDLDQTSKDSLHRELIKAEIKLMEVRLKRLSGNYDARDLGETLEAMGVQEVGPVHAPQSTQPAQPAQPEEPIWSLEKLTDEY
jgi:hypothetical protein